MMPCLAHWSHILLYIMPSLDIKLGSEQKELVSQIPLFHYRVREKIKKTIDQRLTVKNLGNPLQGTLGKAV